MKLSVSIEKYAASKRTGGVVFKRGEANLGMFCRHAGDMDIEQIKDKDVLAYLDSSIRSTITWRNHYHLLFRFFDFWSARGTIHELPMPPEKRSVRQTFVPYIYSRPELKALLKATGRKSRQAKVVERQTMRAVLVLLYATGALVGEIRKLAISDINLRTNQISIENISANRSRKIPIGPDLQDVLRKYLNWRSRKTFQNTDLFVTRDGRSLTSGMVVVNFQDLRRAAGIVRYDGASYQPRLYDLKFTFAVHRITSWIRNGADLNRMLPALATYMGNAGLDSADRYLYLTPERFRKQLDILSPGRSKGHWRNNGELIEFLSKL